MFPPEADISPYLPRSKLSASENDPRGADYANTRLLKHVHRSGYPGSVSASPTPTRNLFDAAITGTSCTLSLFYFFFHADAGRFLDHYRSPKEPNFGLVPNLPSLTLTELGLAAFNQLVTWGTLDSTVRIISQTGDPASGPAREMPADQV